MTEAQEENKCVITGLSAATDWIEQFVSRGYRTDAISYQVREQTVKDIRDHSSQLDEADKIKLAYHILKKNRQGVEFPDLDDICPDIAENPKQAVQALQDPTVDERIASYLQWVRDETGGDLTKTIDNSDNFAGMIASCAINADEQRLFVRELRREGYVEAQDALEVQHIRLTFKGLRYCEELQKGSEASQPEVEQEERKTGNFVWNHFGILSNSYEEGTYLYIVNQDGEERKISMSAYAETIPNLKEKIESLKEKPVSFRTSQNTAKWPASEWFSDIREDTAASESGGADHVERDEPLAEASSADWAKNRAIALQKNPEETQFVAKQAADAFGGFIEFYLNETGNNDLPDEWQFLRNLVASLRNLENPNTEIENLKQKLEELKARVEELQKRLENTEEELQVQLGDKKGRFLYLGLSAAFELIKVWLGL